MTSTEHQATPAPGTTMAPIFGLPGQRTAECATCGERITATTAGQPWTHAS